jgi:hypothetical protein
VPFPLHPSSLAVTSLSFGFSPQARGCAVILTLSDFIPLVVENTVWNDFISIRLKSDLLTTLLSDLRHKAIRAKQQTDYALQSMTRATLKAVQEQNR